MAPRTIKMPVKDNIAKEAEEAFSQRKRPETGRYFATSGQADEGFLSNIGRRSVSSARNQYRLSDRSGVDL